MHKSNMYYWLRLAREVAADWKSRGISKPRNVLPADGEAAIALRMIRRQACKAAGVTDCGIWSSGMLDFEPGTNPCTQCKTKGVSLLEFSESLWGTIDSGKRAGEPFVDEADVRGWINGREPIPPRRLKTAIARAWVIGWIGTTRAASDLSFVVENEAVGAVSRAAQKRWRRSGEVQYSDNEQFAVAVEAELQKMTEENAGEILMRRLPTELRRLLEDLPSDASRLAVFKSIQADLLQICSTEGAKSC